MKQDLKTRMGTATGLVVVMAFSVLWSAWTCYALFYVIMLACLWELSHMQLPEEMHGDWRRKLILLFGSVPYLISILIHTHIIDLPFGISAWSIISGLLFVWMIVEVMVHDGKIIYGLLLSSSSLLYVALPISFVPLLTTNNGNYQPDILIGIVLMVWAFDTGAYIIGSQIGKHKVIPRVSPGKSWEGLAGGLLFAMGAAYLLPMILDTPGSWFALAAIVSFFGFFGDLSESLLKRNFVLKDSGRLLPGHGGFLDRFDSLLFVLVFATLYMELFW